MTSHSFAFFTNDPSAVIGKYSQDDTFVYLNETHGMNEDNIIFMQCIG